MFKYTAVKLHTK